MRVGAAWVAGARPQPALRAAVGVGGRRAEAPLFATPPPAALQARAKRTDAARPPALGARSHSNAAAGAVCPVGPLLLAGQQQPRRRRRQRRWEGFRVAAATDGHEPKGNEDELGRGEEPATERHVVHEYPEEETARTMECTDEALPSDSIVQPAEHDSEKRATGAAVAVGGGIAEQLEEYETRGTGTKAAGGGQGMASGLVPAAAAPSPPSGAAAPAGSPTAQPTLREISDQLTSMKVELKEEVSGLRKEIKAGADVQGGMAERFALLERRIAGVDKQPRSPQLLASADDLLGICNWFHSPPRKEQLLRALLDKRHSAYLCLRGLVLQQLQAEADKQDVQLPIFPAQVDCWKAEPERWQQARKVLLAARQAQREGQQQGSGKTAWLPFLKGAQSYASAAARRRLPSQLRDAKQGKLVLMLLAAQAADRLLDELEFDATPVLEQRSTEEGAALVLDLVEVKTNPADVKQAVEQLAVRARILVYVLATTNAPLLKALGPLKVVGTVELVGRALPLEQQRFWAGQQRDVSCSAAPETACVKMQVCLRA